MIRARVMRASIRVVRGLHTAAVIFLEPDAPFERLTSTQAKNLAMLNQALPLADEREIRTRPSGALVLDFSHCRLVPQLN